MSKDAAAILGEILSEADALIRLRLKEQGLEGDSEEERWPSVRFATYRPAAQHLWSAQSTIRSSLSSASRITGSSLARCTPFSSTH